MYKHPSHAWVEMPPKKSRPATTALKVDARGIRVWQLYQRLPPPLLRNQESSQHLQLDLGTTSHGLLGA